MPSEDITSVIKARENEIADIFNQINQIMVDVDNDLIKGVTPFSKRNINGSTDYAEAIKRLHGKIKKYQDKLLAETSFLDINYDHPVRAARALLAAIEHPNDKTILAFQQEAADSKFFPLARAIGWGVLCTLAFSASVLLISALVISCGPSFAILATLEPSICLFLAGQVLSVAIPIGVGFGKVRYETYSSILDTKETGADIAQALPFFKPPLAQEVTGLGRAAILQLLQASQVC